MDVLWSYLGLISYKDSMVLMDRLRDRLSKTGRPEYILLLQHKDVITLGNSEKNGKTTLLRPADEIEKLGIEIHQADRGGKSTYHGPGQLVGYLILDLKKRKIKIKDFVDSILLILQRLLDSYGIEAKKDDQYPGLYVGGEKIAFVGMNVKNHLTSHGFSLNINNDIDPFNLMVPCGIPDAKITTMEKLTGEQYSFYDVYWRFVTYFADFFQDDLDEVFVEDFDKGI